MAEECHLDMDGMTKQHEIQLTDNQGTKSVTESTTQEISSHNEEAEDHVINRDRPLHEEQKELLDELIKNREEHNRSRVQYPEQDYNKIGWLPPFLLQKNKSYLDDYFRAKQLPIGPVTDGYLRWSQRGLKVKLAGKFIETFSNDKTGECLLIEINNNYVYLVKCYHENCYKNNYGYFRNGFFLDGCAILQFIHSYVLNELEEFGIDNHQASMMREDLFLLQNQIPFRVLELLVNLTNNPNQLRNDIVKFLHMNNIMAPVDDMCGPKQWNDILNLKKQNLHLLDLLHSVIISAFDDVTTGNNNEKDNKIQYLPCCYNQQKNNCSLPLFSCFHRKKPTLKDPLLTEHPNYDNKRFFRNVQELKSAGIEFKPCSSLATISFSSKCFNMRGQLKLPSLTVDEWTERKLINLVAHEACLRGNCEKNQYAVTSYVKFMDFLIDKEQDVKELRASRVLWNRLSSDVDVAKLFNNIGSTCFEPPQDVYLDVKTRIQTHCERKCTIWMAQVYQEHFSSPWTIVALLAAGLVISLTFVQTWYAVHPKD